jgi:VIT1/CCC1 family predicted Fe2+/Mn2+ transporter
MRMTSFVLAVALLISSPAFASESNPAKVSEIAGAYAGVAESCGLSTKAYTSRVEELLKHMAGNSGEAEQLIASYNGKKEETITKEQNERSIDCMDGKRRFEELPINQPGWTVETGWVSEML